MQVYGSTPGGSSSSNAGTKNSTPSPVVDEVLHARKDGAADLNGMHNDRQALLYWKITADSHMARENGQHQDTL
jgi:hypothetical protein